MGKTNVQTNSKIAGMKSQLNNQSQTLSKSTIDLLEEPIKSKNWDTHQIVEHIIKIDGLPKQYEISLINGLNKFNGYNISEVQKKDIKKWGIIKLKHIKQIYEQIRKLEVTIVPPSHADASEIDLSLLTSDEERDRLAKFHLKKYSTVELTGNRKGVIRFFGEVKYSSVKVVEFGIELVENNDEGGEHNGTFNDIQYFKPRKQNGIFVSSTEIIDKLS